MVVKRFGSRPISRDSGVLYAPFLGMYAPLLGYPQDNTLKLLAKKAPNTRILRETLARVYARAREGWLDATVLTTGKG